jgi:hypothetical protein
MRSIARAGPCRAFLVAAALFTATDAFAHTTRSRPVEATIESINLESRTLAIAPAKGRGPSDLALTKRTKFLHNWDFAPATELRPGNRAVVYYRSPFFGKPFVTKIVWVNGA